jgi:hypothetical protein
MEISKASYKKIVIGGVLLVAYMLMRTMGLGFVDLWDMARGEFEQKRDAARAETRAYRESDYSEQVSREMREQAAKMNGDQGGAEGGLNNELAAERKRMMDEGAAVAAQNRDKMLKGDAESLKKRDRRNVRESGDN